MSKLVAILIVGFALPLFLCGAAVQEESFRYNCSAGKELLHYDSAAEIDSDEQEPPEPDTSVGYYSALNSDGREVFYEKVMFPSFDGLEIYGYIFKPEGTGPFPGMLLIHGGRHGQVTPLGIDRAERAAHDGYVGMYFDYRGSQGHGVKFRNIPSPNEDATLDCLAAAEYLAGLDCVDSERLVVRGFSRGSYLAATIMQRTDMFKAAVMWCGYFQEKPRVAKGETEPTEEAIEKWKKYSPCANASKTNGELLIIHSLEDEVLIPQRSLQFADALTTAEKEFTLIILHNAGHTVKDPAQMRRVEDTIAEFFDRSLR